MKRVLALVVVSLTCGLLMGSATASAPNWDVTGTWTGNSGLTGNLAYHFDMNLTQTDGNVTGTISYTSGQSGAITGYVDGNDFYFTRNDANGYWATCWPCTISSDGTYFHGYGTGPGQNVEWEGFGQATKQVSVDIKPGGYPNSINLCSHGVVPIAILSDDGFDATTVDPASVVFAGNTIGVKGKGVLQYSYEDVDGDGDLDFVAQIPVENLALESGSTEATVAGIAGGVPFAGTDTVNIVRDC